MCILRGEKIEEVQRRRMRLKQRDAAYRRRYSQGEYRQVRQTGYVSSPERRPVSRSAGNVYRAPADEEYYDD